MVCPAALQPLTGLEFYFLARVPALLQSSQKKRVVAFIDGYNLYHAIDDAGRHDLKWLDLWKLCEQLIKNDPRAELTGVFYFSAFATWKPEQYARHRLYVEALKTRNVKVILGNFKKKPRQCKRCLTEWTAHEEKESDVNIAIHLLDRAHRNEFDEALIISGDTDLTPALWMVRNAFKDKSLVTVLPPGRQFVNSLINAAHGKIRLSFELLAKCQFLDTIVARNGHPIQCPEKYRLKRKIK